MTQKMRRHVIFLSGLVLLIAAIGSSTAAQADLSASSSQQSQKAPEWVTKGAAAFPELQKKGLIGWASALVKDYDSSDEARDNARNWALGDIAGTLGDLVDSVVNTYAEYAKIAAGAPLTRDEIDGWIRKCDGSARDLLKLDQPSKLETYLDKKSGVWHALAWVELPSKTLSFLVVVEFSKEMDVLLEKKGVKMKESDAAEAVKTVLGETLIWADEIGYDWQLVNEVKDPPNSFGGARVRLPSWSLRDRGFPGGLGRVA
jgi:hypothetical protein